MNLDEYQRKEVIERVLGESETIAVVGLSTNKLRPSHGVALHLKAEGYRIIPVNPNYEEVLGEKCYSSLHEVPVSIDLVDIFRRSDAVEPIVQDAIDVGAGAVWMQEGVVNFGAAELAASHGLDVVMDRCTSKEHARLTAQKNRGLTIKGA